ncbi:MAG TPA: hypothetical protein VHU40_00095 [Polyangia bacterium]|jgi:hypothetical protein|nr:hypothetical protein [Polyangia bacterium]
MKASRRVSVAFALSVAAHGALAAAVVGSSLLGAWPRAPIEVELTTMKLEDLQDLPLGGPPPGENRPKATDAPPPAAAEAVAAPAPAVKKAKPKPKPAEAPDPDPDGGAPPPKPQSVRSYAPEGSRVTVLMRVDRLRDTPYAASVDSLLMRLPDRRDLLDGTDLDLYRDFDALLVATPNPMDPAVTFLAVRHRLTDQALREALERGARATGRKLAWRTERGRPFAERRTATPSGKEPAVAPRPWASRDDRLILLPAPKLAVVTPPAYASLILKGRSATKPVPPGVGGAGGAAPTPVPEAPADEHADFAALIRRIDAEDSIMPANAVVMLSAEDLFGPRHAHVVGGTRGAVDDPPRAPSANVFGLPVPRVLTATIGIAPQPFADLDASFTAQADATRWEAEWPALRRQFLSNPLVVLTGFSSLLGRVELSREGSTVHVHIQATELELIRIMQLLSTQVFPRGG